MASLGAIRILAHQGGWDEILMVLAPLVIFAGLLLLARRRVDAIDPEGSTADDPRPAEGRAPADDPS